MKPIHLHGRPITDGGQSLICTPLVGKTPEEVLGELQVVLPKKPDLIEWRVECTRCRGHDCRLERRQNALPVGLTERHESHGCRNPIRRGMHGFIFEDAPALL